jgi:hypothetical protein
VRLTRIGNEFKTVATYRRKLSPHLRRSVGYGLREARRHLGNAQSAVISFRHSTRTRLLVCSAEVTKTTIRLLQRTRFRLNRATVATRTGVHRATEYRLILPPMPAAVVRNSHRAQLVLGRALIGTRNLLRSSLNHKPDVIRLQSAVPALKVLMARVAFVIQEIVMVVSQFSKRKMSIGISRTLWPKTGNSKSLLILLNEKERMSIEKAAAREGISISRFIVERALNAAECVLSNPA